MSSRPTRRSKGLILRQARHLHLRRRRREAYDRMIEMVTLAEDDYRAARQDRSRRRRCRQKLAAAARRSRRSCAARCAVARGEGRFDAHDQRFPHRPSGSSTSSTAPSSPRYASAGVSTPDLSIRIKNGPMVLPAPDAGKLDDFKPRRARRGGRVRRGLPRLFRAQQSRAATSSEPCSIPMPRRRPGAGPWHVRPRAHAARMRRSPPTSARCAIEAVRGAEAVGRFDPLAEADLFALEYWSLEQAKLAGDKPKPLTGQVVVVTGGGRRDRRGDGKAVRRRRARMSRWWISTRQGGQDGGQGGGQRRVGVACDVTDAGSVRAAFDAVGRAFRRRRHRRLQCRRGLGGPHRRARRRGPAQELRAQFLRPSDAWRRRPCASCWQQGTGGVLLFNTSKQAVNPGAEFRRLWPAQGGDAVPVQAICARLWQGRHPVERGQCRPHPLRAADRRHDRQPLEARAACRRRTTCPATCSARR